MEAIGEKSALGSLSRPEARAEAHRCGCKPPNGLAAPDCLECAIKELSVCGALDPDEFEALERIGRSLCAPAKTTLFEQGREASFVYNLTSGALRLAKLLPDGRRQVVGFALPGDFLGLALAPTHMFTADAVSPVKFCQFPRASFSHLLMSKPHLLRRLMEIASQELTLAQEQMVVLGQRSAEEKVAAFLIGMRERYARLNGQCVYVPLPMTRLDIADYLGLTVETVSRTIARLAREKVFVVVPEGVRLLDVAKLKRIAEA
ncbi:CRP/FNR family transcriptional regulator [Rhodoblastus acidophilus]|uniref:Crp/Fnr family transcriptional regulator n=1 Tax=Rhodoblastus acidophilus TaxID=1074 RepID=UPI001791EC85|nr:helix-turn-helix domain-containing protein [Rhodoblastus acidophilus]MCW2284031.1 CRP/FNR family transcriptional regulator [Rhodoblastus acidophilus]MCW2332727.1 CRP/FNR family transcriptional regulator [Rhodoblastus acidophilus]